jgi:hypothetical protein
MYPFIFIYKKQPQETKNPGLSFPKATISKVFLYRMLFVMSLKHHFC